MNNALSCRRVFFIMFWIYANTYIQERISIIMGYIIKSVQSISLIDKETGKKLCDLWEEENEDLYNQNPTLWDVVIEDERSDVK